MFTLLLKTKSYSEPSLLYRTFVLAVMLSALYACSMPDETHNMDTMNKARQLIIEQKYEETINTLRQSHDSKLKASEYYLMLGLSYYKSGDFLKAIEAFNSSKPESLELKIYISYLYLLSGNSKDAEKTSDALLIEYGPRPLIYILKGNTKLKEEKYTEAMFFFKKALELDKMSVKAIIGLANTFFFQRNFVKAEEYYLKAVYLSYSPGTYISLSNFYKRLRRYEDAENNIKIALNTYPENKHLLLALLNIYFKRDNEKEAIRLIEKLLNFFPNSVDLKVKKIKTLLTLQKTDKALELIEQLQKQFGRKVPYYVLLLKGEYYLRTNNLKQALYNFNNAFTKNSSSYETNYFLGLLNILRGNLRSARQYLEKSISIFPGFTRSHILLSYIYMSEKKYRLANEHCKIVLHLEPDNEAAHSLNGLSLFMMGLKKEADYEFEVTKKIDPKNTFATYMTILGAIENGNFNKLMSDKMPMNNIEGLVLKLELMKKRQTGTKEARKEIQPYINDSPGYLSYLLAGLYFEKSGDIDFAASLYEKSVNTGKASVISYYKLSEAKSYQGKNGEAIKLLSRAIKTDEYFVKPYRALGGIYESEGDFDSAKEVYARGLALFPEDPQLLNNMGWITLTHFRDKSSAYPYIREAMTLQPGDPDFMDTLGWWYLKNHEYSKAITILKKTVKLSPRNSLFYYHLGFAYKEKGEMEHATVNLKKALAISTDEKRKKEILKVLER